MRYFRYVPVLATALLAVPLVIAAPQPVAFAAAADDPDALYGDGVRTYEARDYTRAIDLLTQAINARPGFADAYYYRGLAYYRKDDLNNAQTDMTLAVKFRPEFAEA